ncbi:MAG TPA: response regulator [Gammaproteobacteria bacterium]|nr:response regulator [Gammaproteobacteria bacterium]
MRILLVEDDKSLGSLIHKALVKNGDAVDWIKDGEAALAALINPSNQFDVIILDLGLPKIDGLEVLQKARKHGIHTPVMVLTARDTVDDRVKGLDSGSDDYLTKPFDLDELSARLRALQRRATARTENNITFGNIELNPATHTILVDKKIVTIPRREFALMQKLLENIGHVVTRETLAQTLYGWNEEIDSNTLEVHIHNLRNKFGKDVVRTIRGVGYMIEKLP